MHRSYRFPIRHHGAPEIGFDFQGRLNHESNLYHWQPMITANVIPPPLCAYSAQYPNINVELEFAELSSVVLSLRVGMLCKKIRITIMHAKQLNNLSQLQYIPLELLIKIYWILFINELLQHTSRSTIEIGNNHECKCTLIPNYTSKLHSSSQ